MEYLLLTIIGGVILFLAFLFMPLKISVKQKAIFVILAIIFSQLYLILHSFIPNWQAAVILIFTIVISTYLFGKYYSAKESEEIIENYLHTEPSTDGEYSQDFFSYASLANENTKQLNTYEDEEEAILFEEAEVQAGQIDDATNKVEQALDVEKDFLEDEIATSEEEPATAVKASDDLEAEKVSDAAIEAVKKEEITPQLEEANNKEEVELEPEKAEAEEVVSEAEEEADEEDIDPEREKANAEEEVKLEPEKAEAEEVVSEAEEEADEEEAFSEPEEFDVEVEVNSEPEPVAAPKRLNFELMDTLVEQLFWNKQQLNDEQYEQLIIGHVKEQLHDNDYYLFASMLRDHYIKTEQSVKLKSLLNKLKQRFNHKAIILEEITFFEEKFFQS